MPTGRKLVSKAQWRFMELLYKRGAISKKKFSDMKRGVTYSRLPEKAGSSKGRKMRRKTRVKKRGHSMRGALRRRGNPPPFDIATPTGRRTQKDYYKTLKARLARKRKFGYTMSLRRRGFGKYKRLSKAARHIGRPFARKAARKTHRKSRSRKIESRGIIRSVARRIGRRSSRKMTASHKRKLMAGLRRWQRKHGRKSHRKHAKAGSRRRSAKRTPKRKVWRKTRRSVAAMRRGWKKWFAAKKRGKARRSRALRKGRKVRARKLYGRRPLISRAARRVKRYRPSIKISAIRRMISRDLLSKAHRRGSRNRSSKVLARDTVFGIDYRRALKGQHIRTKNMRHGSWLRKMGRHPSHLRRRLPRRVVRGWKEFAGYKPNLVASFKGSPVKGTFNGVLVQKLTGSLTKGGSATIVPPTGKELMFMWSNGARTFEIVGGVPAITSLAKSMAQAGCPIRLKKIEYAAMRYPVPVGARRTPSTRADILYFHNFAHEVYLSWNGKFGSKARFPIITRGTRGASMVNRSGIVL